MCVCVSPVPDDFDVFSVLALAVPPLAVHDGRVHVGGGEGVGLVQQRDHAEQDGPEKDVNGSGVRLKYRKAIQEGGRGGEGKMEVRRDKRHGE